MSVRFGWILGFILALLGLPSIALAAKQCAVPSAIRPMKAERPPPGRTVSAPVTGHILALSWSPQFCKEHRGEKKYATQCEGQNFGFILHGLWADGDSFNDPQWCKRVTPVPVEIMRQTFCATPSLTLMQHEWAKHGSCIESDPGRYFRAAIQAYDAIRYPDIDALARKEIDVGDFVAAFVAANPGLTADMVRIDQTPLGYLQELRICLDRSYRPRACPGDIGGSGAGSRLRITPVSR